MNFFGDHTIRIHLEADGGESNGYYPSGTLLADWNFAFIPNPGWIREFYVYFAGSYQIDAPTWWIHRINWLRLVPSNQSSVTNLTGIGTDVSRQLTSRHWDLLINFHFRAPTGYPYWATGPASVSGNIYFTYLSLPHNEHPRSGWNHRTFRLGPSLERRRSL